MSNVPLFPKEEGTSSDKSHVGEDKVQYKRPEFILIDDRQGKSQYTYFGADSSRQPNYSGGGKEEPTKKGSFSLRFICLLGLIFCLVFGLGILIWSIVITLLATLSLFQNHGLNQAVRSFWKIYTHTVIVGFGFALGLMSPTLGLGLIALYFSMTGELMDEDFLRKVIRRSFYRI
jgi:hypothetical protein